MNLLGSGSGSTRVLGEGEPNLVVLTGGESPVRIEALALEGANEGLRAGGSGSPLMLVDVRFQGCVSGLVLEVAAKESASVAAHLTRFAECTTGLRVHGSGEARLELEDCGFRANEVGLRLEGPSPIHRISVRRTWFHDQSGAGVMLMSEVGINRAAEPYTFQGCEFRRNDSGILFEKPAGDSPLLLEGCRFLENVRHGLWVAGTVGAEGRRSHVRDCQFRWNGIGVYLAGTPTSFEIARCEVLDSLGFGIICANFLAEPVQILLHDNLVAHNGSGGIMCLSDARSLELVARHNTVVFNRGPGLARKTRHGGDSQLTFREGILAGNRPDLLRVDLDELTRCLVAGASAEAAARTGNLTGDPGFVDAGGRDFRLRAGSPCIDAGQPASGAPDANREGVTLDREGRRRDQRPDLGAHEFH